jgi:hypothetical protein
VFKESWLGYGNNLAAPAEKVQFFNIDTLNGKVKSLEARVQNLTDENWLRRLRLLRLSRDDEELCWV